MEKKSCKENLEVRSANSFVDGIINLMDGITSITYVKNNQTATEIMKLRGEYLENIRSYSLSDRSLIKDTFDCVDRLFNDLVRSGAF